MGTMLYSRGVFINACFDELNLTRPRLVQGVHADYVSAGADIIETNTFGANPVKLRGFGLAERAGEISREGARLARDAAGTELYVAGSVGPCLQAGQAWRDELLDELRRAFAVQIQALAEGGVDLLVLETFTHPQELEAAALEARAVGLPVFAGFAVGEDGVSALGLAAERLIEVLDRCAGVDCVGLNCGAGPGPLYDVVERCLPATSKPFFVMPNAGVPREVDGRMIYMSSPEYFASYARKFVQLGVRAVGGCCGTTPEHIRDAARAVHCVSTARRRIEVRAAPQDVAAAQPVPTAQKSRLASRLLAGERVVSIELLPPRSCDLTAFLAKAAACHARGIDAVNIPDGPRASARVSPMVAAIELLRRVGIEPILHYCCRDRNLIGMQSDLLGGYAAGLRNFLVITGDPPKLGDYPDATGVFDVDSIGLAQVAANLNRGTDIGGNPIAPPTGIFIGVGANPCAISLGTEIERYHAKVRAGAEFVITQPVFDAEALLRFLDRVEAEGSRLPVLAGVWPLVSYKNAEFMRNEVPGVTVPDAVMTRMAACSTKEDGIRVGVEIARETCALVADRIGGWQISAPFGRVEIAFAVLE
jgi:homocysteine S-methyltransferase